MRRSILALYQLIGTLLLPIILAGLVVRSRQQKAYRQRLGERCGLAPSVGTNKPSSIVVHGASLGEITALKPFVDQALATFASLPVTVTSFTPAGSQQVQQLWGTRVQHCYLPLDNPIAGALFLRRLKPVAMVFMETELWPNLIAQAHARHIPLLLVNARLSQKSVRAYQKFAGLMAPAVQRFSRILAQSHEDCARFIAVGAHPMQCVASGNLKYDIQPSPATLQTLDALKPLVAKRKVWVIGSSHKDEEQLLLDVACALCERIPELLIVWAPRHRERFTSMVEQLQTCGLSVVRRSTQQVPSPQTQVWLVDTLGELLAFYGIANVCTVAGSFGQAGGHNPLEPALFSVATTVGPNMRNAAAITAGLLAAGGLIQHANALAHTLVDDIAPLLQHPHIAAQLGANAGQVVLANQGATSQAIAQLRILCNA